MALNLDSGKHLDTPQYEKGQCTMLFNSAPKPSHAFDWVYACWNRFGSVATARHPHVGNICLLSFSNRTRHFWETDNFGLADLRTQRYSVELKLPMLALNNSFYPQSYFPLWLLMSDKAVCVCVYVHLCVCVPSFSSWHSLHVINIHLHLRENQTRELASGAIPGILGWFGQKNNTPFNSHYILRLPLPVWLILKLGSLL